MEFIKRQAKTVASIGFGAGLDDELDDPLTQQVDR